MLASQHTIRSFLRGEPEVVIRWAGWLILGGLIWGMSAAHFDLTGVISAVFAVSLGAAGGMLEKYRTERGLWMLAVFFLTLMSVIYGMIVVGQASDILRGAPRPDRGIVIDFTLATALLAVQLRFLAKVARCNWWFSQTDVV